MRNALHEQLLKAGLISEQQLEAAERDKRRREEPRPPPTGRRAGTSSQREKAKSRRDPAVTGRKEAAEARGAQEAARRALEREIVQLIKANRHPHNDGDEIYNFIDGRKVGRIYCTAETRRRLVAGELAVVRLRSRYALVPTATAAGIASKAPELVLVANTGEGGAGNDDPAYAEHPIPDDLHW